MLIDEHVPDERQFGLGRPAREGVVAIVKSWLSCASSSSRPARRRKSNRTPNGSLATSAVRRGFQRVDDERYQTLRAQQGQSLRTKDLFCIASEELKLQSAPSESTDALA